MPRLPRPTRLRVFVLLALLAGAVAGAWQLAFLCDDAFITFRYVSNARDGFGLVWNPPPFQPIDGHTGLLWSLVLWATWSWFGVEPPDAANVLSMALGAALFAVVAFAAFRLRDRDGKAIHGALALATVFAVASNRTFLQWWTSGLDTALFNLPFVAWVLLAFRARDSRDGRWLAWWSACATIAATTRPDGMLLVAATAAAAVFAVGPVHRRPRPLLLGLSPLLVFVAQLLWRRSFYGEWLPNTWYAKVVEPWPEAGARYFVCFLLEHGLWLWFPLAAAWCVWFLRRTPLPAALRDHFAAIAAITTVAAHAGYYVYKVGGDHFEYRVLSQLVPLGCLSFTAMAAQLAAGPRVPLVMLAGLWLASTVGWVHLALTQVMPRPSILLAKRLPGFARPVAHWYDSMQSWLHLHSICLRRSQHRDVLQELTDRMPPRARRPRPADDMPVFVTGTVGVAGWVLPDAAIIDIYGLNDWVVARCPVPQAKRQREVERLRPVPAAADTDHDGWLTRDELRLAVSVIVNADLRSAWGDEVIDVCQAVFGRERHDALSVAEALAMLESFYERSHMAHEREPPPGYVEAFEPNLEVVAGELMQKVRTNPLTHDRIRAIEAEWRAKVRSGEVTR